MIYTQDNRTDYRAAAIRLARKLVITVFVLILLFGIAGIVYVYFSDRQIKPKANPTPSHIVEKAPFATPPKPDPRAAENVSMQSLISPVNPGQNSSIDIHTNITSTCTISVTYNNVPSTDSGLVPKKADAYGNVSWTWTVPLTAPIGTWPVKVTCIYNGRSGVYIGNLEVTKSQVL